MKTKSYWIVTLVADLILFSISMIIPAYKTRTSNTIGGADWPTFMYHFQKIA